MSGEGVRRGDGIGLTTKEHTSGLLWGDLLPADEGLILRPLRRNPWLTVAGVPMMKHTGSKNGARDEQGLSRCLFRATTCHF